MRNKKLDALYKRIEAYSWNHTGKVSARAYKFNNTQVAALNQAGDMVRDLRTRKKQVAWRTIYTLAGIGVQFGLEYLDAGIGRAIGLGTYPLLFLYMLYNARQMDINRKIYTAATKIVDDLALDIFMANKNLTK